MVSSEVAPLEEEEGVGWKVKVEEGGWWTVVEAGGW